MKPAGWGLCCALLVAGVPARAADTWGHITTSQVKPEVEPDSSAPPTGNGVYGRFKGDLELGLGLGAEMDKNGARGAARLALHYFSMLGVYSSYRDGFGHGDDARLLSVGVDLRPGFVPRWAKAQESGDALPDLLVDSISLGLGAFWAQPAGHDFGSERGFESSLGFGVPLMLRADGLWLEARGQLRWPETAGAPDHSAIPSAFVLLSWHGFVVTPLAASHSER